MTDIYTALNKPLLLEDLPDSRTAHNHAKSQFWGTQQRVFKQLLVSQKVNSAVELAKAAVARGSQVVMSLWGTGESRTAEKIKEMKDNAKSPKKKKRIAVSKFGY